MKFNGNRQAVWLIAVSIIAVCLCSMCAKPVPVPAPAPEIPENAYVLSVLGHSLYKATDLKKPLGTCPLGTFIEPMSKDASTGASFGRCHATGEIGYYTSVGTGKLPKNLYYKIVSRNGLNLRNAASLSGKILRVLPYQSQGKILASKGSLVTIQEKKGVWILVEANDIKGWLFSGFILYSDSNEALSQTMTSTFYVSSSLTKFSVPPNDHIPKKTKRKFTLGSWDIIEYVANEEYGDYLKQEMKSKIFFRRKNDFFWRDFAAEAVVSVDLPMPGIVITRAAPCIGCCGGYVYRIYLLRESEVITFPFSYGKVNASCGENMADLSPILEARFANERLMYRISFPWCYANHGNIEATDTLKSSDIISEIFFEIDARLQVKRLEDISSEAKAAWETAVLFERPK